jgi:hypothetical protein
MFEQLLEYPNKRQLQAWCEEWGVWDKVREWKTLSAQVEGVRELHCGEGKGLRVLKALFPANPVASAPGCLHRTG